MSNNDTLTVEEALRFLPKVHTMVNPSVNVLLGADWDIASLVDALRSAKHIGISGEHAMRSGHGIYMDSEDGNRVFIACDVEALEEFDQERANV
ncbi:MAG: hypothetical protein K0Q50_204 [Vampirovibrio sp.]|jgi:hypothetical protein|nr:hypothetical protein [Vampirovibrio sp.]